MKQLLQSLNTGELTLEDIPCPQIKNNHLIVQTTCSLISSGTERMLLEFGRASIIGKVKQQPEKVKQVFDKIKTDGVIATLEAVKSKLDQPIPLGYCQVGLVREISENNTDFTIGDRVVTNGPHAEMVRVPKNLSVKIPNQVDDESAAFAVLGAVALQGIRLAAPTLGESFAVIGLGLVGQLAVQLLVAQGCRVLAIDLDKKRCELAEQFGATAFQIEADADVLVFAENFSRHRGMDGVLITASTQSNSPIEQAAKMSRQRGRIVLVGVTGLALSRDDFYKKELSFQVSCSYGPGRYDENYEKRGQDYPIAHARWTAQRNIEAFLDMLACQKVKIDALITHRFIFSESIDAYKTLEDKSALGILLKYPVQKVSINNTVELEKNEKRQPISSVCIACIGAGNFASRVLLPEFKKANIQLHTLVTDQGINAVVHGKKNGFIAASTDIISVLNDEKINTILIATPHHLHADQVTLALSAGKHVFVEKPLAITEAQLQSVVDTYQSLLKKPIMMIGFNRRFSPHIQKMKQLLLSLNEPKNMIMTVNAGFIPKEHWTQNTEVGGGRLIGEACHFVDLLRYIANAPIKHFNISSLSSERFNKNENVIITLQFADGSQGSIHYFANGSARFPKERLEVFCAGKILQLDNFRILNGFGFSTFKKYKTWRQQKGYAETISKFVEAISGGSASPIPFDEIIEVSRVCLELNKLV